MKRRKFLKIAGTSSVIVAASAAAGFEVAGMGSAANKPWHIAGSAYSEPRKRALSWAILAPNPHNRQPWLVKFNGDLSMTLSLDMDKMLPQTDPVNRQILIGLGCFCELLSQAAAEDGYKVIFNWFPQGVNDENNPLDNRPIANIDFLPGGNKDPLFKQVLKRRSNKELYDPSKTIPSDALKQLHDAGLASTEIVTNNSEKFMQPMRKLTMKAMQIEFETERTYMESIDLMRIGRDEVKANPDGIDLDGRFFMLARYLGILTRKKLADMNSSAYQQGFDTVIPIIGSSKGYMWVVSNGNARQQQIDAGRSYVRVNLKSTELGLQMHPISQCLQEYEEMAEVFKHFNQLLGITTPKRVQMLTRLGYGQDVAASPRWAVEKIIQ